MMYGARRNIFYPVIFYAALALLCSAFYSPAGAEGLGRLFTTAEQRRQLQRTRYGIPEPKTEIVIEEIVIPDEPQASAPAEVIHLKGVVYREDGKHVLWINDGNTLSGDFESEYIRIRHVDIEPDQIRITGPDDEVTIRVGDPYDPGADGNGGE